VAAPARGRESRGPTGRGEASSKQEEDEQVSIDESLVEVLGTPVGIVVCRVKHEQRAKDLLRLLLHRLMMSGHGRKEVMGNIAIAGAWKTVAEWIGVDGPNAEVAARGVMMLATQACGVYRRGAARASASHMQHGLLVYDFDQSRGDDFALLVTPSWSLREQGMPDEILLEPPQKQRRKRRTSK
jgi:hypothetical protein